MSTTVPFSAARLRVNLLKGSTYSSSVSAYSAILCDFARTVCSQNGSTWFLIVAACCSWYESAL
eukprot:3934909-Rhodomonas_salina.3